MNIVVIYGGRSSEREVSLRSGRAVGAALERAGHSISYIDPKTDNLDASLQRFDVIFPIIHGTGGEDGTLQKHLDKIGVPYVGSGASASELCFDKARWRQYVKSQNITVANGALVTAEEFKTHPLTTSPFVLKPYDGGSTIDTIIVRNPENIPYDTIESIFSRHSKLLIEQLIDGTEITVAVLGDTALPVIEIIPPANGEFDYENKYNGKSQELCPPEHVDDATQQRAQKIALDVHTMCGCRHLSRTDMIIQADGTIVTLETNTLPGMTDGSLVPKAASTAGLDMSTLCDRLVHMASS